MAISQGQTTYSLEMVAGYAGQIADLELSVCKSYPVASGVTINPGQLVMLASDGISCTPYSASSSSAVVQNLLGIAALDVARQAPDGSGTVGTTSSGVSGVTYSAGDIVPVCIRGAIFASFYAAGTTAIPAQNGNGLHINASSTTLAYQGTFTTDAVSASAGSEITLSPAGVQAVAPVPVIPAATLSVVKLEVNFPAIAPTT